MTIMLPAATGTHPDAEPATGPPANLRQLASEGPNDFEAGAWSAGSWSAPLRYRSSPLRHSPGIVEGPSQQQLDVGIEAAEIVGGPLG
jgi:hypothetical protein